MPFDSIWFPEGRLRGLIGRFKVARIFDPTKVFLVRLVIHGVLAQGSIGILQGQPDIRSEPDVQVCRYPAFNEAATDTAGSILRAILDDCLRHKLHETPDDH